ncbi:hypothetical protein QQX98_012802 [Neonectria punicea]|uniref:Uncharacterized protein n=1 Tax=Neonectria punicea TaxID=979145 RepID=A0ABR1GHV1_9HYPO
MAIPGLYILLSIEDLEKAALVYNLLPDDKDQPEISLAYLEEITEIIKHGLGSLISLQVLNEDKDKQLKEFVLGDNNGAVMLDAEDTNIIESYRVTGYVVETDESGVTELKGNKTHTPTIRQTH